MRPHARLLVCSSSSPLVCSPTCSLAHWPVRSQSAASLRPHFHLASRAAHLNGAPLAFQFGQKLTRKELVSFTLRPLVSSTFYLPPIPLWEPKETRSKWLQVVCTGLLSPELLCNRPSSSQVSCLVSRVFPRPLGHSPNTRRPHIAPGEWPAGAKSGPLAHLRPRPNGPPSWLIQLEAPQGGAASAVQWADEQGDHLGALNGLHESCRWCAQFN